jgi:hypothetical protein
MDMAFEEQMGLPFDRDGTNSNRVEELTVLLIQYRLRST